MIPTGEGDGMAGPGGTRTRCGVDVRAGADPDQGSKERIRKRKAAAMSRDSNDLVRCKEGLEMGCQNSHKFSLELEKLRSELEYYEKELGYCKMNEKLKVDMVLKEKELQCLRQLNEELKGKYDELQINCKKQIEELDAKHEKQNAEQELRYKKKNEELQCKYKKLNQELQSKFEKQNKDLQSKYEKEKDDLQAKLEDQNKDLQSSYKKQDKLQAKYEKLQEEMQAQRLELLKNAAMVNFDRVAIEARMKNLVEREKLVQADHEWNLKGHESLRHREDVVHKAETRARVKEEKKEALERKVELDSARGDRQRVENLVTQANEALSSTQQERNEALKRAASEQESRQWVEEELKAHQEAARTLVEGLFPESERGRPLVELLREGPQRLDTWTDAVGSSGAWLGARRALAMAQSYMRAGDVSLLEPRYAAGTTPTRQRELSRAVLDSALSVAHTVSKDSVLHQARKMVFALARRNEALE